MCDSKWPWVEKTEIFFAEILNDLDWNGHCSVVFGGIFFIFSQKIPWTVYEIQLQYYRDQSI